MLPKLEVDNIYIFIADSLRLDHLPDAVASHGRAIKTIASSLSSPSSFSSIVTGLHPVRHRTYWWGDRLQAPRVFDIADMNSSFADGGRAMYRVLNDPPFVALEEIGPPFFYIERDLVPHMPYNVNPELGVQHYFKTRGTTIANIRADYAQAADDSARKFMKRLLLLESRGLLQNTLVIFTSDHGELLGEYGLIGHNTPACPELVYVPTVFIHPSLKGAAKEEDTFIRHVDLVPTALGAMGRHMPADHDGINLFQEDPGVLGFNHHQSRTYSVSSIWDGQGGRTFANHRRITGLAHMIARIVTPHWRCLRFALSNPRFIPFFVRRNQRFGDPGFSEEEAASAIEAAIAGSQYDSTHIELDEEVVERLRSLGYLE